MLKGLLHAKSFSKALQKSLIGLEQQRNTFAAECFEHSNLTYPLA